jgi:hypothetical protein
MSWWLYIVYIFEVYFHTSDPPRLLNADTKFFCTIYACYIHISPSSSSSSSAYLCLHCWGTGLPYGLPIRRTGYIPPRRPSAGWWVQTTANAAGTKGLTCLPIHGGVRDNKFLVTHPDWPTLLNFRDCTLKPYDRGAIQLVHLMCNP